MIITFHCKSNTISMMFPISKILFLPLLLLMSGTGIAMESRGPYQPTWDSLDARPLPRWYDEAKLGIVIHWGVYSVPSFDSEWFWWSWQGDNPQENVVKFMNDNYPPEFKYVDFASQFTAELWDPNKWADLFADSGAKYVVLTSKHHEGYTLYPSSNSWNWSSLDVGPRRDLVGELATAIRNRTKIHFGVYNSLMDWFHPMYLNDKSTMFANRTFPQFKTLPELYELVYNYNPDIIWSDGDWEAPAEYWQSREFLAWLYNESPVKDTVVTNDRWGRLTTCRHGGYYTCHDIYKLGVLQKHKWENYVAIDEKSFGYRREATLADYLTIVELISMMVSTVSCGGNFLINVGPTKEGTIPTVFEERLRQLGGWMRINGEAIYASVPWKYQNDTVTPNIWYTSSADGLTVYAIVLKWPNNQLLSMGAPKVAPNTKISMLGLDKPIKWKPSSSGVTVQFPVLNPPERLRWAWVLKLTQLK